MKIYSVKAIDHNRIVHSQTIVDNVVYTTCGVACGTFKSTIGDPTTCKHCLEVERKAPVPA